MNNMQLNTSFANLGAALALAVTGCNNSNELDTSFESVTAPVQVETPIQVEAAPKLIQHTVVYEAGKGFDLSINGVTTKVNASSSNQEARVIASLLDYMTKHLGFEAKIIFMSDKDGLSLLPAENMKVQIAPPNKLYFKNVKPGVIDFSQNDLKNSCLCLADEFVRITWGEGINNPELIAARKNLKPRVDNLLARYETISSTGIFEDQEKYTGFVNKVTDQYAATIRVRHDELVMSEIVLFVGNTVSRDAMDNLLLNEYNALLSNKGSQSSNDSNFINSILDIFSDPTRVESRSDNLDSTRTPSVTGL